METLFGLAEAKKECRECPVLCALTATLMELTTEKNRALVLGNLLVGESGQMVDDSIDTFAPSEKAGEFKATLRRQVGDGMETIDQEIAITKATAEEVSAECSGTLTMRAPKNGTQYTVQLCTAPVVYEWSSGGSDHLPAHISTKPVASK